MSPDKTGIEWTDATWNPTTGCDQVSAGCDHCYALTMAKRLKGMGSPDYQNDGDPATSGPGFAATMHPHRLDQPLRWTRPRRIFVNSMSDLFHEAISDEFIIRVFAVMALAPQHTFQVLTKRHGRMRSLLGSDQFRYNVEYAAGQLRWSSASQAPTKGTDPRNILSQGGWPLPNVWLGVSVEDQKWADIRIPALLDTPAAVRFLSCEPLLGPIDLREWLWDGGSYPTDYGTGIEYDAWPSQAIDWVIVGGESGRGARPMHPEWVRALRDQCTTSAVPFLFKQWGEWAPGEAPWGQIVHEWSDGVTVSRWGKKAAGRELDGRTWDEYPELVTA